jgi:YfiR/HmsC-like
MLLILVNAALLPGQAEPLSPTEYQVKAAFIYNFAKFVEWPMESSAKDSPFVIGILGQDPFGGALDEIVSGKTVRDKKITVKRFSSIDDAMNSRILFISKSEKESMGQIIKRLDGASVLTISDIGQFAEQGGMIELVIDHNRVRFAINVAATEQAGLKPSSQLLKLARIVTSPAKAKE